MDGVLHPQGITKVDYIRSALDAYNQFIILLKCFMNYRQFQKVHLRTQFVSGFPEGNFDVFSHS